MEMNFKFIKYKKRYLELQNQLGGMDSYTETEYMGGLRKMKEAGFSLKDKGFSLKDEGFSFKDEGFSVKELFVKPAFQSVDGKHFTAKELYDAGYSAKELYDALKKLKEEGYTAKYLKEAGYTLLHFEVWFSEKDTYVLGAVTAGELVKDFSTKDLKKAQGEGFLKASVKDLKHFGFSAKDLKEGGYFAKDLKDTGFFAKDLKDTGYSDENLKERGRFS